VQHAPPVLNLMRSGVRQDQASLRGDLQLHGHRPNGTPSR
jgi:hypothetical protein